MSAIKTRFRHVLLGWGYEGHPIPDVLDEMIAAAEEEISVQRAEERERCAKIADEYQGPAARLIAGRIRDGATGAESPSNRARR
jgi:hypothetical protein